MRKVPALLIVAACAGSPVAGAQAPEPAPATATTTTTVTTASGSTSPAQLRIVNAFSDFAGSEENSRSLVTGLRQGGEITLSDPGAGGQAGTSTTFTPPTRPMGYGNVRIALSLARAQLAQAGITQPTSEQLAAALMGGTVSTGTGASATTTEFPGVLQMRADGMGWGQIANGMGVKLGHVMSGRMPPAASTASASTAPATSTTTAVGTGAGITTASGGTSATVATRSRGNSAWAHQSQGSRAGIVTAAGDTAAGLSAGARMQGGGRAGVVTAAGAASGSRASAAGRARGKAHTSP